MKKIFIPAAVLFYLLFFLFISCTEKSYDLTPSPVTLDLATETTDPYFNLGRMLFYDPNLSVNTSISCASCHKQALAFSDNVPLSRGFENRLTLRNSLPIQNIESMFSDSTKLFWDGREQHLRDLVFKPILNHVEMGMGTEEDILDRVIGLSYYRPYLDKISNHGSITKEMLGSALTNFVGAIRSFNSRFDQSNNQGFQLTALEKQGEELFESKYNCNSCHHAGQTNFYDDSPFGFENIGLEAISVDKGRYNVTSNPADIGKFKVPSLRNIALTKPYMHDGRFATLEQVLDHYSHNIADNPALSNILRDINGQPIRMNISDQEKTAIIAFLNTLTDYQFISNPEFRNPFVH
jgi:cytochrome c peroxidase